jgi:hypothetical protein
MQQLVVGAWMVGTNVSTGRKYAGAGAEMGK